MICKKGEKFEVLDDFFGEYCKKGDIITCYEDCEEKSIYMYFKSGCTIRISRLRKINLEPEYEIY